MTNIDALGEVSEECNWQIDESADKHTATDAYEVISEGHTCHTPEHRVRIRHALNLMKLQRRKNKGKCKYKQQTVEKLTKKLNEFRKKTNK